MQLPYCDVGAQVLLWKRHVPQDADSGSLRCDKLKVSCLVQAGLPRSTTQYLSG